MFCPNCGKDLSNSEVFCGNCGYKLPENIDSINKEEKKDKKSHKKQFITVFCGILLIAVVILSYKSFYGGETLKWDNKYEDNKLKYVLPSTIKLGVKFNDKEKIKDIKYETTCGKLDVNDLELNWDLTEAKGTCEITAKYKLKKISKEITIIKDNDINKENLFMTEELDPKADDDLDGIINSEEEKYKTNSRLSDTDMDELDDNYELFTSKTDPLKSDTDADGIDDYSEIELGLDPLKTDSKGDGVKDGERVLTYNYTNENVEIKITGKGNLASVVARVNTNTKISGKKGLLDTLYSFHTNATMEEAIVTINYDEDEVIAKGLNEDNLSIYYYDEKTNKYEKVETIIDKESNKLTATLKHFSNYVVGDSDLVNSTTSNQILFILDNSWSMYTDEQYKEITGEEYNSGLLGGSLAGFDKDGLRFTLTSDLIQKLATKQYKIGLSEFRSDYKNAHKIGTDVNSLKSTLATMNGNFITSLEGTNITNALNKGVSEFENSSDNKFIIILTDGQDTSLKSNVAKIIENAIKKDVKICAIGFGGATYSTELSNIANGTGCKFYSSTDVNGLEELFSNVSAELNDDLVDLDGDEEVDGILIADSGFIVNRDGFSFANYVSNLSKGGHCYGMATFAQLYYKKVMPLKFETKIVGEKKAYAYDLLKTNFKNYPNLYEYKLQSNALKYTFGFELFGEIQPKDFLNLDGTLLAIKDEYKEDLLATGIYDINVVETSLSKKEQLESWGVNYETAESELLNEDKMQNSINVFYEDVHLLNAVYMAYLKQKTDAHYSSGSDFILWLRNVFEIEIIDYKGKHGFINILKSRLNDKDAPVISSRYSGGLHAVNAISLIQDIDDPNHYYIGVYDNNYPGEKRYVDLKCNKKTCSTLANDYYTSTGEPVRLTPSLEYDLEYYE